MQKPKPKTKEIVIKIDEKTAAILQAIADAPEGDLDKLVEIAKVDPEAFAEFAKKSGLHNSPEVKAIIAAAKKNNQPPPGAPPQPARPDAGAGHNPGGAKPS
jgi:Na+-transporting methylmalonyl-CoA/oxaloacetate decarboxylase gamma subunit